MTTVTYPLTRGLSTLIDAEDLALIEPYAPWSAGEFSRHGLWYAFTNVRTEKGWRVLYMHRLLMNAQRGQIVDHINGDGLDNRRRDNLQFISHGENIRKGRLAEQKLYTRDAAPKETTRRRGCRPHPYIAALAAIAKARESA